MEEYIVSARKYRPLTFDSVVGQRALTTTLQNAIASGKLAHAYLFCGPRGVGKTTCARIFAKAINCLQPVAGGDACGECESCRAFNEGRSMNIHELDGASNNSVEDIRELCKQVQIPPQIGRYKVFIIDEVHMLSQAAFNAFLKTLEEPPHYVIFILATTEKHKILPTILSRCQVYDFQRMTISGTIDHLRYVAEKEGYKADPEALNLIAQKADGGMRDALSIFDQMVSFTGGELTYESVAASLGVLSQEYYFRVVDHALKQEVEPCMLLLNEVLQKGFDGGNFIGGLATHLRDLMVSRDAQTVPLLEMSETMRARYQEQAQRCKPQWLYRAIRLCNDCDQAYRTSRNKRLQVEICLIQVAQLGDDVAPGSGLGPAKILKPLFQKTSVGVATQAVSAEAHHQPTAPTSAPAPSASPQRPVAVKPMLRTVSFGNLRKKEEVKEEVLKETTTLVTPLTEEAVRHEWNELSWHLPQNISDLASRLRAITPVIQPDNVLLLTVSNPNVKQSIQQHQHLLLPMLRERLKNCKLDFAYAIQKREEITVLTTAELYQDMLKRNPRMRELAEVMQLQMD